MRTLKYAVRPSAVLKYFGQLCLVSALLTLVPLTVSLLSGDYSVSIRYTVVIFGIFLIGSVLVRLPAPKKIQTNEAMVISAMIFLFISLAMTWPMMKSSGLPFSDALFETVSAITTTGLTTASSVSDKSTSFLFARAWMQWIGGLGIVVLSLAVMIGPGFAARRLGSLEDFEDDMIDSTRAHARKVLIAYAALTGAGIIALGLLRIGWFDSVLYCLAAISTGGFSPHDTSLAGIGSLPARSVVILLCMVGGLSLILYYRTISESWRVVLTDAQFQGLVIAGLIMSLLMALSLRMENGFEWSMAIGHGAVNALSAQSTAGFSSLNIGETGAASKLLLILSMVSGGAVGSTAGGVKILRILIFLQFFYIVLQRSGMPRNAVTEARLGGRRLEADEIQNALFLFLLFVFLIVFSWLPFLFAGYSPVDSLFEVVSAVGTCGLSTGITNASLHPFLKTVLCIDMLLGRLEIIVFLIMIYPGTWLGKRLEV